MTQHEFLSQLCAASDALVETVQRGLRIEATTEDKFQACAALGELAAIADCRSIAGLSRPVEYITSMDGVTIDDTLTAIGAGA